MKRLNGKIISIILVVLLSLSVVPISAMADNTPSLIKTGQDLIDAAAKGGEYTIDSTVIYVNGTIVVKNDLTLNIESKAADNMICAAGINFSQGATPFDSCFLISGATLNINCKDVNGATSYVYYSYNPYSSSEPEGSIFKLVGVEGKDTKLNINGGQMNIGYQQSVWYIFNSEAAEGTVTPQINLNSSLICEKSRFLNGKCDLKVYGGTTPIDPSEYLAESCCAIERHTDHYLSDIYLR